MLEKLWPEKLWTQMAAIRGNGFKLIRISVGREDTPASALFLPLYPFRSIPFALSLPKLPESVSDSHHQEPFEAAEGHLAGIARGA